MASRATVVLRIVLVLCLIFPSAAVAVDDIPIPMRGQESGSWCRSAGLQAVLAYAGVFVNQCEIASEGRAEAAGEADVCCPNSPDYNPELCNGPFSSLATVLRSYGMGDITEYSRPLDAAELKAAVDSDKPVLIEIQWKISTGLSHVLAAYGYQDDTIHVMDPGTGYGSYNFSELTESDYHTWVSTIVVGVPSVPPTGVTASDGVFTAGVRVTWDENPGTDSYQLWRSTQDEPLTSVLIAEDITGTSFFDTGPHESPGQAYYYWIRAKSGDTVGGFSFGDKGFRKVAAPVNVTASHGAYADKVVVSWDEVPGADFYTVYRSELEVLQSKIYRTKGTFMEDTQPAAGAVMYYHVKAEYSKLGAMSSPSAVVSGFKAYSPYIYHDPPLPPENISADSGPFPDKVRLMWTHRPGVEHYKIYRSPTDNYGATFLYIGKTTVALFEDTNVEPESIYYYRITSNTSRHEGDISDSIQGVTSQGLGYPSRPRFVTASRNAHKTKIKISFEHGLSADHYEIYHRPMDVGTDTFVPAGTTKDDVFYDTDVSPYITYEYLVKSVNSLGSSGRSDKAEGYVAVGGLPPAPVNVSASDGSKETSVLISWSASNKASSYIVYRAPAPHSGNEILGRTASDHFYDTTAVKGRTYYYRVKSVNNFGESDFSEYDSGYILLNKVPGAVKNVTATQGLFPDKVRIVWESGDFGAAHLYEIHRSTQGDDPALIGATSFSTAFDDTTAKMNTDYDYQVRAVNFKGSGPLSEKASGYRSPGTLTGWWHPSDSPGQSLAVGVDDGRSFIVWRCFTEDGDGIWYAGWLESSDGSVYAGPLSLFTGSPLGEEWTPPSAQTVGSAVLTFYNYSSARFDWALDEHGSGSLDLVKRQASYAPGDQDPRGITGWWLDAAYPGSGYFLEAAGNTLEICFFHFGEEGAPTWLLMGGQDDIGGFPTGSVEYFGEFIRYMNGPYPGNPSRDPAPTAEIHPARLTVNDNGTTLFLEAGFGDYTLHPYMILQTNEPSD